MALNGIKIPAGSTEYVGIKVTGPAGLDLTSDSVEIAIVEADVTSPTAPTWLPPDIIEHPTINTIIAKILVGPVGGIDLEKDRWRLWVKVTDTPEVPWIAAPDPFRVV